MVDFELTDDEKEDDDEENDQKNNGKPAKDDEEAEDRNGVLVYKTEGGDNGNVAVEPTDEDETDLDENRKPLGDEASDANSSISSYSTPSRTPRSSQHLLNRSWDEKSMPDVNQHSANTEQPQPYSSP